MIKSVCRNNNVNNLLPDYLNVVIYSLYTGVGLSVDDNVVFNNSVILTNDFTSFGQLHCVSSGHHDASQQPYWILPNNVIINETTSQFSVQSSNATSSYLFTSLSVNANGSAQYMRGQYQCVIQDEYRSTHILKIWIFINDEFQGTV